MNLLPSSEIATPLYLQHLKRLRLQFLEPSVNQIALSLPPGHWKDQYGQAFLPPLSSLGESSRSDSAGTTGNWLIPLAGLSAQQVTSQLEQFHKGQQLPGHPSLPTHITPQPTLASIAASLWPMVSGPNLCSSASGSSFTSAEQALAQNLAKQIGWEPETCAGIFTFGGTGTILYALRIAIQRSLPDSWESGLKTPVAILCSEQAHHACQRAAAWLGIGKNHVIAVQTDSAASMRMDDLENKLRELTQKQIPVAAILATCGTTDAFGFDSVAQIDSLRRRLQYELHWPTLPYLHADAVVGWPWIFFGQYDFAINPLQFPAETCAALKTTAALAQQIHFADSWGVDFHKTGFTPYTSSLLILREKTWLDPLCISADEAPYFLSSEEGEPGAYTLETSRSGIGPIMAWASLWQLGITGFQVLLAHATELAESLKRQLAKIPGVEVLNPATHGPAVLARIAPARNPLSPQQMDQLQNQTAADSLQKARSGNGTAWGITTATLPADSPHQPSCKVRCLKAFCFSPHMTQHHLQSLLEAVRSAAVS
ncbi:MAG: pyridoxal-dependent decarboxylase [Pirellulales bacterium]